jgi:CheY-like chemotaxis protein
MASAADALVQMEEIRPDLILLDMVMPGLDGLEFLARVRRHPAARRTPVLIVSAYALNLFSGPVRELGIAGVLAKPILPAELVATARQVLWGPP